jgi:hypothetical protein
MAAMWTCVALLYSQKILFSKILNLTPRAIKKIKLALHLQNKC